LEVTGTVRGEISHIFPLKEGARSITSPSLKEVFPPYLPADLVNLTRHLKARIDKSGHTLENMDPPGYLYYELDLVADFQDLLCKVSLAPIQYGGVSERANKHTPRMNPTSVETTLSQLWDVLGFDRTSTPSPLAEACRLAVVTDDSSSFVPSQARVGDVLVDLEGSACNILALVRVSPEEENGSDAREDSGTDSSKDRRRGKLLGRCVDFMLPDEPLDQRRGASLLLDLRILQLLTSASMMDCRNDRGISGRRKTVKLVG
jgi:hypothetical protein